MALRNLSLQSIIPGRINTSKCEVLIPLEDNTTSLWRVAITKTFRDVIAEPREKKTVSERRLSVLERRSSLVSICPGLERRTGSVGVLEERRTGTVAMFDERRTGSLCVLGERRSLHDVRRSVLMLGRSKFKAVKVTTI